METELAYLVSNHDIMNKFHGQRKLIKIIIYSKLSSYKSILELLPYDKCACFILLRTSNDSGHWTCIVRNDNAVYYFDSYGVGVDGEFKNISLDVRYSLGENDKLLTGLVGSIGDGMKLYSNKVQFQEHRDNVNTCGKHVTVFTKCIFNDMSLADYQKRMLMLKNKYETSYDSLICVLWDSF